MRPIAAILVLSVLHVALAAPFAEATLTMMNRQ